MIAGAVRVVTVPPAAYDSINRERLRPGLGMFLSSEGFSFPPIPAGPALSSVTKLFRGGCAAPAKRGEEAG